MKHSKSALLTILGVAGIGLFSKRKGSKSIPVQKDSTTEETLWLIVELKYEPNMQSGYHRGERDTPHMDSLEFYEHAELNYETRLERPDLVIHPIIESASGIGYGSSGGLQDWDDWWNAEHENLRNWKLENWKEYIEHWEDGAYDVNIAEVKANPKSLEEHVKEFIMEENPGDIPNEFMWESYDLKRGHEFLQTRILKLSFPKSRQNASLLNAIEKHTFSAYEIYEYFRMLYQATWEMNWTFPISHEDVDLMIDVKILDSNFPISEPKEWDGPEGSARPEWGMETRIKDSGMTYLMKGTTRTR